MKIDWQIYFYANLGNLKKPGYGGGEEGNRRTLSILKKSPYQINVIPKYTRTIGPTPVRQIRLALKMAMNLCSFIAHLSFGSRKKSLVHIVGFYGIMVYWENMLVFIAKALGYNVIYEMRGGGADSFYRNGSAMYKKTFRHVIGSSASIISQGMENLPLIREVGGEIPVLYYPNYVMPSFLPDKYPLKPTDRIDCVYFGRLSKSKNIDIILKSFRIAKDSVHKRMTLTLIGKPESSEYRQEIIKLISELELENDVTIKEECLHDELKTYLRDKHFYLFPTAEKREGHSNALTEAMAYGIIPIASNHGFNKSVIGEDSLVVDGLDPKEYASVLISTINSGRIPELSMRMYDRIRTKFSYEAAEKNLLKYYSDCFNRMQQ